jgi:hypothetical protein
MTFYREQRKNTAGFTLKCRLNRNLFKLLVGVNYRELTKIDASSGRFRKVKRT